MYCTDYILNNMIFLRKGLLDTLMQTFIMLLHLVAETSRFKFDDNRVIRTGTSDLKLFLGVVDQCETIDKYRILKNTSNLAIWLLMA